MSFISPRSLENLKHYSYKTNNRSVISRGVTLRLGRWFNELWPAYIAPNMITLLGLSFIIINFFTLLYYDPLYLTEKNLAVGLPHWVYYTWGLGLFASSVLDAVDGMQARRTGMASPLGEFFDHGCDSISMTLIVILAAHALGLGRSWWTVVALIATHLNFYLTIWDQCYTGELMLGFVSDPIEGRIIICASLFISGFFGPSVWNRHLLTVFHVDEIEPFNRFPSPPLNKIFRIFRTFGLVINALTSCTRVRHAMQQRGDQVPLQKPFITLLSFLSFTALQIAWLSQPSIGSWTILSSSMFLPFLCLWGLQFSRLIGKIILSRVTAQPFPLWDRAWVLSLIGAIDANLPRLVGIAPIIQRTEYRTSLFLFFALLACFVSYAWFVLVVIREMTQCLGITCFSIKQNRNNRRFDPAKNPLLEKED